MFTRNKYIKDYPNTSKTKKAVNKGQRTSIVNQEWTIQKNRQRWTQETERRPTMKNNTAQKIKMIGTLTAHNQ